MNTSNQSGSRTTAGVAESYVALLRAWDIWRDFIIMFACSLSNPVDKLHYDEREARYMKIIKKYNKQEQAIFPELAAQTVLALEENQEQDFLGSACVFFLAVVCRFFFFFQNAIVSPFKNISLS